MGKKKKAKGSKEAGAPEQMRVFAEQSVDQVRKAFDDILVASQTAIDTVDAPASPLQSGAVDMGKQALGYAEENVSAALDLAQAMIRAKTPEDMMALQRDYLKSQMTVLGEQTRAFSETATREAGKTAKSVKGE